jgi:SET domain-containing protein
MHMNSISPTVLPFQRTASIVVKHSAVHGNGVFATRKISAGSLIIEYEGKRITEKQAMRRKPTDPDNPWHTFYFSLDDGRLIDGADNGNEARWINHCCEPNCEAREEDGHIFIHALRDLEPGEELNYDYGLIVEDRHTATVRRNYECRCGAPSCRHTMLAPKRKSRAKVADQKPAGEADPAQRAG